MLMMARRLQGMKTAHEIRMDNFRLLLSEAGGQAKLADATGVPAPLISQLNKGVKTETGKDRSIGNVTARKLESGMMKPVGWMDRDHSKSPMFEELTAHEAQLITLFRRLPQDDRDDILTHTNNVFSKRFPERSPENPFGEAQPVKKTVAKGVAKVADSVKHED